MSADYVWSSDTPPSHRFAHPVTLVRWSDAVAFCEWPAKATGRPIRLPTKAEWERAARGGSDAPYPTGDAIDTSRANYLDGPSVKREGGTTAVGPYVPNDAGLYDMAGNVWEWIID